MATIVGLINPHSTRAADALAPWPHRSSGWRLFCMFSEASGCTADDYLAGFRRYNLALQTVHTTRYPDRARRLIADGLIPEGEHVVLLGQVVRDAFEKALVTDLATEPFVGVSFGGRTWYYIPHPSGLTRSYNDPEVRKRAGQLLTRLYKEHR